MYRNLGSFGKKIKVFSCFSFIIYMDINVQLLAPYETKGWKKDMEFMISTFKKHLKLQFQILQYTTNLSRKQYNNPLSIHTKTKDKQ